MNNEVTYEYAKDSLMYHTNNKKHICETLRMIYDEVHELPKTDHKDRATELLIEAMMMAKKMQNRLHYYQTKYHDNTGNKAKNIIGLTGVRARTIMRKKRYEEDHRRTN